MTSQAMDVLGTYQHLKKDLGFHEVGFAPVTTSPNRLYSINERGLDSVLDQFRALADGLSGARSARRTSRIFKRQRHARRTASGHQQIASLRRGAGTGRRGPQRRSWLRVIASSIRMRTRWAMFQPARSAPSKAIFWRADTSIRKPIAAAAGRGRYARAAAIMRPTCATATPAIPIFITAIGFAAGRIPVLKSTAPSPRIIPQFLQDLRRKESRMKHLRAVNQKAQAH